jgi:ABC-type bacteriocin/lantibiotic exporter with double-glycine peptidase domain
MEHNISILQYIKKKYNINYLEEIISLFYVSLLCSIIIYLSMKFEVIQMTCIIFIILFFSMYLINQYYKKKYEDQLNTVNEKMKYISELVQKISEKNIL